MVSSSKGFTLIEVIVAVGIFVIVMVIAVGAVINAVDANRKAQSMSVVVNNLNLSIESMVRDLRTGYGYYQSDTSEVNFTNKDGISVVYYFDNTGKGNLVKGPDTVIGSGIITSDEVTLESVTFNIEGNSTNDGPERILLNIKGYAGSNKTQSNFNIQTLITSRTLNIND